MPRTQTVLTVLLACPSDIIEELEIVTEVVREVNATSGRHAAITLDLVRWDLDVTPGVGNDPQEVINARMPTYDIFLSVMWTKVGTPTPRAESGTIEEFDRACGRFKETPDTIQILVFFSQVPIDPTT